MAASDPTHRLNRNSRPADEAGDQEIISSSRQVDERFLPALARRIVEVSGATRVILFGSRAQ